MLSMCLIKYQVHTMWKCDNLLKFIVVHIDSVWRFNTEKQLWHII